MELDADKLLENALRDGIRDGIKRKFESDYDSPLKELIKAVMAQRDGEFRVLLNDALSSCLNDAKFRESVAESVRHSLAKTLVARFGGELEKQVNVLKSDPSTRARITLAIEEIVKQK